MTNLYLLCRKIHDAHIEGDTYDNETRVEQLYRPSKWCERCETVLSSDIGKLELLCRYTGTIARVSTINYFHFPALNASAADELSAAIAAGGLTGVEIREATVTEFEDLVDIPPERIDGDGNVIYPTVYFLWMPICEGRVSAESRVVNFETGELFEQCEACSFYLVERGGPSSIESEKYLLPRDVPNGFRVPHIISGHDSFFGRMVVDDALKECILEHLGDTILEFKPFDYVFE